MRRLLLIVPLLAAWVTEPDLPTTVTDTCERLPASGGLLHLRCGGERLLIVQPHSMQGTAHDEILDSLVELVPGAIRRQDSRPGPDRLRTVLSQSRSDLARGTMSVRLSLTTDTASGRSVACMYAVIGKRSADKREAAWCERIVHTLLPTAAPVLQTTIQVQEPTLLGDDL